MPYKTGTWGKQAKERAKNRNEYMRLYRKRRNPLKLKARKIVESLLRRKILFPKPCEKCGKTGRVEAHHEDYSKPLEINWFCPLHHREQDNNIINENIKNIHCLHCFKNIKPPRKKFCSSYCNNLYWKKSLSTL